jgi:hypothetical protein
MAVAPDAGGAHPLTFFAPEVVLSSSELDRIDAGKVLVKRVAASSRDVAIFSAARIAIDGDRFVSWIRRIEALKRSTQVLGIARFSSPPSIDDLASLALEPSELAALRSCQPGDCDMKLDDTEMARLRRLVRARAPGWEGAAHVTYREILLARVRAYLARGLDGVAPYHDRRAADSPAAAFPALLADSTFLTRQLPAHVRFLHEYPAVSNPSVESFLYWSKERLRGQPVVSITHVTISRSSDRARPDAIVLARQVYASHYMTGALAVTALVGGRGEGPAYLAYMNRSRLDLLSGTFGGLVRRLVVGRLEDEAGQVVDGLRRRLQSGEP